MARSQMFETILLFIDSSDAGVAAAGVAIQIAKEQKAKLVAVTVVDTETLNMLLRTKIFLAEERDEYEAELAHEAERYQRYVEKLARAEKIKVEFRTLKGVAHRMVAEAAHDIGADLIVMGTAQEKIGQRNLLSRERQMILGEVGCSVLLVPPAGQ